MSALAPVAMIRGVRPYWKLYDRPGPDVTGQPDPLSLATFYGEYTDAQAQARAWCDEHGYYLSSYSDADDRRALDEEQP